MDPDVGATLRVQSSFGVSHYGIYVGPRGPNGEDVVHNAKWDEVQLVSLAEFADGRPVEVVGPAPRTWWHGEQIAERALSLLGRRYELLGFNCEHATNFAVAGNAVSPTVTVAATVAAVLGAWALATRS